MPVDLPAPPPNDTPPSMPNPLVWAALFVAVMAIGVAHTLLTWPKDTPTNGAWFWLQLLFFPAMAWSLLLGLRLLYVEQESDRIRAEHDQWKEDRDEAVRFAQEPLALLGMAYRCGIAGRDVPQTIAQGRTTITAQRPGEGLAAIPHTRLAILQDAALKARYEACFIDLLERLDNALRALPARAPLEVYLLDVEPAPTTDKDDDTVRQDEPKDDGLLDIRAIWQQCWAAFDHREVSTFTLASHDSMMILDAWLDEYGGPALEKFALIVAVQLHHTPPANSAEAAVALLVGWAPLAQRNTLPINTLVHRPIIMKDQKLVETMATALSWGHTEASQVTGLWQAALDGPIKTDLIKIASDLGLAACTINGLSGVHDIDRALGNAGIAAPWLALAIAAQYAARVSAPQIVITHHSSLCMAVVQPVMPTDNAGSQG